MGHCWHKTWIKKGGGSYEAEVCCFCNEEWGEHSPKAPPEGHGKYHPSPLLPAKPVGICTGRIQLSGGTFTGKEKTK